MTAATQTRLRTWYQPTRDRMTIGACYCTRPAVGYTTFYDGERYRTVQHCEEHLPAQGGGQS